MIRSMYSTMVSLTSLRKRVGFVQRHLWPLRRVRDVSRPPDIIKEVAILSDRSDISEEISRMASHLKQFEESLSANDPIGRKLEFLLQEMFREANTMASKSIHTEMNRILVEYRSELDRLKEQVQNVE